MADITHCCNNQIIEKKTAVKDLWDALLKNSKIIASWENVNSYWSVFKFTQNLLDFMKAHSKDLTSTDSQCISDDFIREFISTEVADEVFKTLIPCIRMDDFNITLSSVAESKVSIMIGCKYFDFTVARYEEIKESFPNLRPEFILQNQTEYIALIDNIQMDSDLYENLLLNACIEEKTAQTLLDTYCIEFMTPKIARNLQMMEITMNLKIFNAVSKHLDKSAKKKLMIKHVELLDATALHSCFTEIEGEYRGFLDRSKPHVVELETTPENQKLAERLKAVDYITSYPIKQKEEYDPVAEVKRVRTVIQCRVKAVK